MPVDRVVTPITVGSLFSGIGGLELGLERAGMRTVWQVEKDDYARKVLAKHWPDMRRHDDVCTFPPGDPDDWRCDLICGGFPCQDISNAGRRAGIDGERSGLWSEYARIVGQIRPRYVLVENVAALLIRGMGRVLGDLAALGYDAEWEVISAASVGAPHLRERVFMVAYPQFHGRFQRQVERHDREMAGEAGQEKSGKSQSRRPAISAFDGRQDVADAEGAGEDELLSESSLLSQHRGSGWSLGGHWEIEPDVGRVADGVPARMDRLRCLGNAVVPQVAEFIGRLIVDGERGLASC